MNARQRRVCRRLQSWLVGRRVLFALRGSEGRRAPHRSGVVSYVPHAAGGRGPVWWLAVTLDPIPGDEDFPGHAFVPMRNLRGVAR